MTALSRADAARDARFLKELEWGPQGVPEGLRAAYADLPFASLLAANGDGLAGDQLEAHADAERPGAGRRGAPVSVPAANSYTRIISSVQEEQ